MRNAGILASAFALGACAPPTEPVGSLGTTSGVGGSGDGSDGDDEVAPETGLATTTSTGSSSGDSSGDGPVLDMGAPDVPAQECNDDDFCDPTIASPIVLSGTSPVGPVTFEYALWGPGRCMCWSLEFGMGVVLSSAPLDPFDGEHPTVDRFYVDLVGGTASARFYRDGVLAGLVETTTAITTMPTEPLDPAADRLVATIEVTEPGWELQGTIDAALCYEAGFQIPCD